MAPFIFVKGANTGANRNHLGRGTFDLNPLLFFRNVSTPYSSCCLGKHKKTHKRHLKEFQKCPRGALPENTKRTRRTSKSTPRAPQRVALDSRSLGSNPRAPRTPQEDPKSTYRDPKSVSRGPKRPQASKSTQYGSRSYRIRESTFCNELASQPAATAYGLGLRLCLGSGCYCLSLWPCGSTLPWHVALRWFGLLSPSLALACGPVVPLPRCY